MELPTMEKKNDEKPRDTVRRLLSEKLGVITAKIEFITAYSQTEEMEIKYGLLYRAYINEIGPFPRSELSSVYFLDTPPEDKEKWKCTWSCLKKQRHLRIYNQEKQMDVKKYFKKSGLIPAIITDAENGEVLMLAYMNEESLQKTLETGYTWFWSRSRQELWNKGATSGHFQKVVEIYSDCDDDTLLIKVIQTGAACHTGNRTCFFNRIK